MRLNVQRPVRQLKAKGEQRSGNLRLGCKRIHAGFRKVEQDAVKFPRIRQRDFNRSLYWNAECPAAFARQQSRGGPQSSSRGFFGNWFVENEVCTTAQDLADLADVRDQSHGEWLRPKFLGLQQNIFGHLLVLEIHDQGVELLLLNARQGSFGVARPVRSDAEAGQNSAQHVSRGIVARYQQCLKVHNSMECAFVRGFTASEELWAVPLSSQWNRLHSRPPSPPVLRSSRHHRLPPAQRYLPRRSRPAAELLPAIFPQPAGASQSVYRVGRISPASAAGPHGYPSYYPLLQFKKGKAHGSTVIPVLRLLR